MMSPRTAPLIALILSVALVGVWLLRVTRMPAPVPEPVIAAWPETDADGRPLLAVYEGRLPCALPDCEKVKTAVAFYGFGAPLSFWLGRVYVDGRSERTELAGLVTTGSGMPQYPGARVLTLSEAVAPELRRLWEVSEDVLIPLDPMMQPIPGTAAWGTMLSRTR